MRFWWLSLLFIVFQRLLRLYWNWNFYYRVRENIFIYILDKIVLLGIFRLDFSVWYSKRRWSVNINKRIFRRKVCVTNFSKASFLLSAKQELMRCRRRRALAPFLVLENGTRGRELRRRREQIVVREWKNVLKYLRMFIKMKIILTFRLIRSDIKNHLFYFYFQLINQSLFILQSRKKDVRYSKAVSFVEF